MGALVAVGISSGTASAAGPESKPVATDAAPFSYASEVDRQRMRRQAPLHRAADLISEQADKGLQADRGSGFVSIALESDAVVLTWKGPVPAAVRSAVEEARRDVAVEVRAAKYSRAQLKAAEARIKQALTREAGGPAFAIALSDDGSGVVVDTEGDVEDTKRRIPSVGLPIAVRHNSIPRQTSRLVDSPPWWGGARIRNATSGGACSSGFGVTAYGRNYLLTAAHCGAHLGDWYNGDFSRYIGYVNTKHSAYDIMLITGNVGGRIYDGGVGFNEFSKDVVGWGRVYSGEWLCVSGSVTGAVCGLYVNNLNYSYCGTAWNGAWVCVSDLVTAYQGGGQVASQPGDSGGPVFNLSGPNVIAKGVISGSGNGGRTVVFQDFATVNIAFGATPL